MKKMMVIVGLPGSGKDTQIEALTGRRKIEVIRVGDLVRKRAEKDPSVAEDLRRGNLADDEMVNGLIEAAINQASDDTYIISDGFPRDIAQAKWLMDFTAQNNVSLDKVVYIKLDDSTAMERLLKRGRDDDNESTIRHRLDVFHALTDEAIEYFRNQNKLVEIDGSGTPAEVETNIQKVIGW